VPIFQETHNPLAMGRSGQFAKVCGFSLVEMLLSVGLGGAILVSAMALMLSFAHIYMSSREFESEIERNIFAEKLVEMFLSRYGSSEGCSGGDEPPLNLGIFYQTDSVPMFVDVGRGNSFTLGLARDGQSLNFVWKGEGEFECLKLFDGIEKICISGYDAETDSWLEYEFTDKIVRQALETCEICCLRIVHRGEETLIPLFRIR
jgi:hypothetical protein